MQEHALAPYISSVAPVNSMLSSKQESAKAYNTQIADLFITKTKLTKQSRIITRR